MADILKLIEEGKIKRYFRARNKLSFEGSVSHVTQHGAGKDPLFIEDADYLYMLHVMKESCNKYSHNILSFSLMLNHIHLLIRFNEANMSFAMKDIFERYARYFNAKYARKGHLFSGSFRSALCFDNNYLLAASLYIHFNPVKANLVRDPVDYRWSSCALFLREVKKDTFIDYKFVLGILDDDISVAQMKYKGLLEGLNNIQKLDNVMEEPKALESIVRMLKETNVKWQKEHGLLGGEDLDKQIEDLKKKGRIVNPQEIKARQFLIEQLKARGFSISEIAEKLDVTRQTIYKYR